MTREQIDSWVEKGIQLLVIAILVFGPLATGAVRTLEFLVIQGMTIGALALWMVRLWLNSNHRLLWPPVCWIVLAFVAYGIVSYRLSEIQYAARGELIRIVTYAVLFFVVLNNFSGKNSAQMVSAVLLVLATAISFYAIYQFVTNSDRVWHFVKPPDYLKRGSGTYICPNHLAGFLEMVLPLGLAVALTGRVKPLQRILCGYASIAILAGIGVSVSRGGWIATGVSLLVFFWVLIRKRQHRIPALLVMLLLIGGAWLFFHGSQNSQRRVDRALTSGAGNDSVLRIELWTAALKMWRDHPWSGVGPGLFDYHFPQYRPVFVQLRAGYVHNDYLNCLADWGAVGTALVLCAWVLMFIAVVQTWKYVCREDSALGSRLSNRAAFVIGATTSLVAILVHSLFDFNMHIPANAILAVTLFALLAGYSRFASERYWLRLGPVLRSVTTLVGIAGVVYLSAEGRLKAREYRWIAQGRKESSPAKRLDALKQAAGVDPSNFEVTYAIGESLRALSWLGNSGFEKQAAEAVGWFDRGIRLNPYDAYNYLRTGMCLDWLGRGDEAAPYYEKALSLDPNNYYLQAHQGWHYVQVQDYEKARFWFQRSFITKPWDNAIAVSYLAIVERKLKEAASEKR